MPQSDPGLAPNKAKAEGEGLERASLLCTRKLENLVPW